LAESLGSLLFHRVEKFRTNASYGERLIERVLGSGPDALTNTFTWTTNGYLEQVVRSDGSWEFYRYDSSNRPTNILSSFGNQGVTTNANLCRWLDMTYSTNVIAGAGDTGFREITLPRRSIDYVLGQEVRREYNVVLEDERRHYACPAPGVAWNFSSNLVTTTKLFTSGFYKQQVASKCWPDGREATAAQIQAITAAQRDAAAFGVEIRIGFRQ
jgi:hypothetical protein